MASSRSEASWAGSFGRGCRVGCRPLTLPRFWLFKTISRKGAKKDRKERPERLSSRDMHNKVALVTGASGGIGKACALALADAGARVALAARRKEKLEEVAAEIRARSREAYVIELDLASDDSIKQAFAATAKEFGRIDILINNAGIAKDGLALRMKKDDWNAVIETNLTG